MTIGEIIKKLRIERNMTQTEVAKSLGVTSQAVSKWENEGGLPDITQLVPLADLFGVSVDIILDHSKDKREEEIIYILNLARNDLRDNGKWEEMTEMLRHSVRKYPDEYRLMEMLCNALYYYPKQAGFDCTPEAEKCAYECIDYAERILKGCTDNNLRYNAVRWLVYQYSWLNNDYQVQKIAETMPPVELSREGILTMVSDQQLAYKGSMNFAYTCLKNFCSIIDAEISMKNYNHFSAEERVEVCHMMISLIRSYFSKGDMDGIWYGNLVKYYYYGALYNVIDDKIEESLSLLNSLVEVMIEWNEKSEELEAKHHHVSPLLKMLDSYSVFPKCGQSSDSIISKRLEDSAFDKIKETEEFKIIMKALHKIENKSM